MGGEHPEPQQEHCDIDPGGGGQVGDAEGGRAAAEASQPGEQGGGGQAEREDQQQRPAAGLAGPEAGALGGGDVPDLGHRVLASLGHAAGTPEGPGDPDHQAEPVGWQRVDVLCELGAEDRELGQGRVQDPLVQGGVAAER